MYVSEIPTCFSRGMSTPAIRAILCLPYPCFCLCFGSVQITMITPRRLMTLHFSQRGLTDADTFTDCLVLCKHLRAADNAPARMVVFGQLDSYPVTRAHARCA